MFQSPRRRTASAVLAAVAVALWTGQRAAAQGGPTIQHEELECLSPDEFPLVDARIDPGPDVRTAKVYFRSDKYPDFYYVLMDVPPNEPTADFFLGILPKPSPETERIIYYIEAIDRYFNGERNEQNDPLVDEKCRRDPAAAYWTGESPGIIVGATTPGAAALPPGFQAVGIVGTIASTGAMSGVGGGASIAATVGVAASAAGVGGFVVATNGGGEPPPPAAPSSPASTTTAPIVENPPPGATTTTTTIPPSGGGPPTTTTSVAGGPATTTTVPGGPATTTTVPASSTTSSASTTTTSLAPVSACFNVTYLGGCKLQLDASCSTGTISSYDWNLDESGESEGPYGQSGKIVVQDYGGSDGKKCSKKTVQNRLTVTGGNSSTTTLSFTFPKVSGSVPLRLEEPVESSFTSFVGVQPFDGSANGAVVLNGRERRVVENASPSTHRYQGVAGRNSVEAALTHPAGEGFWRFDFSGADHFVPGSFEVQSGQVLSRTSHEIVFRVSGAAGESLVFRYELARTYRVFSPR